MKSKKLEYIESLMKCNSLWILRSFQHPNKYMTNTDLILHAVAYRRLTGINLFILNK
jgi:hypothetical protein